MSDATVRELREGDAGPYAEQRQRSNPAHLALVFMPPLIALLEGARHLKQSDLTPEERGRIRDGALVVAMPSDVARAVAEERGYPDIPPDAVEAG